MNVFLSIIIRKKIRAVWISLGWVTGYIGGLVLQSSYPLPWYDPSRPWPSEHSREHHKGPPYCWHHVNRTRWAWSYQYRWPGAMAYSSVNVTGLKDAQAASVSSFLGVTGSCFYKRLAFKLANWVQQMALPDVDWHYTIHHPSRTRRTKRQRKGKFVFSAWGGTYLRPVLVYITWCQRTLFGQGSR